MALGALRRPPPLRDAGLLGHRALEARPRDQPRAHRVAARRAGDVARAREEEHESTLRSPETYLGDARGERRSDRRADELTLNQWALAGEWSVGDEAAVLDAASGSIAYRFEGRDLNLVLAPPSSAAPVTFAVLLDGRPPDDAHGLDVDESGNGIVSEPRMYQLVRQRGPIRERAFEITFDGPGVHAYVFTFG